MTDESKDERRSAPPPSVEASGTGASASADPGEQASAGAAAAAPSAAQDPAADAARAASRPSERAPADPGGASSATGAPANADPATEAPAASDPRLDELEALRKERTELAERLLRTAADFDNFRKRSRREAEDAKLRGKDDALRELLPVFDNLERAVRASDGAHDTAAVVEGVRMVLKLFEDTAQRMGLNRVPTVGERFDPAVHEAIQQQETDEHAPGTIIAEVAPGYAFGKRLLRAAMVIVARRPTEVKAPAAPASGAAEGGAASGEAAPPAEGASGNATGAPSESRPNADSATGGAAP